MDCDFQYTTVPGVYKCSRCHFVTAYTTYPPDRVSKDCEWENVPPEIQTPLPDKLSQIANYAKALVRFAHNPKFVTEEQYTARVETCDACRHRRNNKCLLCGCRLKGNGIFSKARLSTETCPAGKWIDLNQMNLLFRNDKLPAGLEGIFAGWPCFLIGCGPSIHKHDLTKLHQRGILKMAVNNVAAEIVYPNLWISVDDPGKFSENIWRDPTIMKFVSVNNHAKPIYENHEPTKQAVYQLPNVYWFYPNEDFEPELFLTESSVNWGNHTNAVDIMGLKGGRSVMYAALKILYWLGIKNLFLLGVDFEMKIDKPYAFDQRKHQGGCSSNNSQYYIMNERFKKLRPIFEKENFFVHTCTPESKLDAFDYMPYEEAIQTCLDSCPPEVDIKNRYDDFD